MMEDCSLPYMGPDDHMPGPDDYPSMHDEYRYCNLHIFSLY